MMKTNCDIFYNLYIIRARNYMPMTLGFVGGSRLYALAITFISRIIMRLALC